MTILKLLSPFKWYLAVGTFISLLSALDLSIKSYCIKWMIDGASSIENPAEIWAVIKFPAYLFMFLTLMIFFIYRTYHYVVNIRMIPAMRKHLTVWANNQLMQKPYGFFQNQLSGSLSQKVSDLTNATPDLIELIIDNFLWLTLSIVMGVITLASASPIFGVIMAVWSITFIAVTCFATPWLSKHAENWAHLGANVSGNVVNWISNFLNVFIFSRKKYELSILEEAADTAVHAERKMQWAYFFLWSIVGIWTTVMYCATVLYLVNYYEQGFLSKGDFALVLTLNMSLIHQVWHASSTFGHFSRLKGRIQQALNTLESQEENSRFVHSNDLPIEGGSIKIESLNFKYPETEEILFEDFSLSITIGQKIGVVGYSGGGKSTLAHLILNLLSPQSGAISIDGHNISDFSPEAVRKFITFIPQDTSLFHRTLMENIRYGKLEASDEEVILAAKQAHAHEFIASLPDGYSTIVGERGLKLSGGQRQRIAIARAFLKATPILILDEATSQLDSITEQQIQSSLWKLMQGRTTIVVAHRLSTLLHMDRILVLNKGKVIEDGTHSELMEKNQTYTKLWNMQVGGLLNQNNSN